MKVENSQENLKKCVCGSCPSHNECMKGNMEGLFCARVKTGCNFEEKGCTCGGCPITSENSLTGSYYCSGEAT